MSKNPMIKKRYIPLLLLLTMQLSNRVIAQNEQVITPAPSSLSVLPNDSVSFNVIYSTNPVDQLTPGLGLRIHFDSTKLAFVPLTNVLQNQHSATSLVEDDAVEGTNFDNDTSTNNFINVLWADFNSNPTWPGTGNTVLFQANFTAKPAFSGTTMINFSASAPANGFTLNAQSVTVSLAKKKQVISTQPQTFNVTPNDSLEFDVNYATNPLNERNTGVSLRLHFDSNKLIFDGLSNVLDTNLFSDVPNITVEIENPDLGTVDTDANTNSFINVLWFDTGGNWPGDGQTRLYTANFTAKSDFANSTNINFSASSVANGFELDSSSVLVASGTTLTQTINFNTGWNQFSLSVEPGDLSPNSIFNSLISTGGSPVLERVIGKNAVKKTVNFDPDLPNELNTLDTIEIGAGYWVKVNQNGPNFTVNGQPIAATTQLSLKAGWNHVGYFLENPGHPRITLDNLIDPNDDGSILPVNVIGDNKVFDSQQPDDSLNTLNQMVSGKAYWIHIDQDHPNFQFKPDPGSP